MSSTRKQIDQICSIFQDYDGTWGICGGWAISLWLGAPIRTHGDIDIAVLRKDHASLYRFLSGVWKLGFIDNHKEQPWHGEKLELPIHEMRARRPHPSLNRLELLMNESDDDLWRYRRDANISYPLEKAFVSDQDGIPIIAPEIVLLYKSKYADEVKNEHDFRIASPNLDDGQRNWLKKSIEHTDPKHPWIRAI